ncbi:unnamed protein product, partial [Mesorhabditis belari]|uniref:Serpentine receptor class gamma n=1 Tax=Mesorhabditis belari TaxID=2138241 RepID=A0AAF3JB94_9BILA
MFFSIGVADVASLFINAILRHLTVYKIGPEEARRKAMIKNSFQTWEWLYRVAYLVSALVFYVHFLGHCFLSLNRFTSVLLPGYHRKFWAHSTKWFIFAKWFAAFALISYRLTARLNFVDQNDGTYLVDGYNNAAIRVLSHLVSGTVCGVSTMISMFLSMITLAQLYCLRTKVSMKQAKIERNLMIYTLLTFLSSLVMDWQQFYRVHTVNNYDKEKLAWIGKQYFWINDILVFSNLYTLIICCWPVASILQEAKWTLLVPRQKSSAMQATFGNVYSMRVQWSIYASTFEALQKFIR